MKYIFLNLKRFDVPKKFGGVSPIDNTSEWGRYIMRGISEAPSISHEVKLVSFFPESHIITALEEGDPLFEIGCQSVHQDDVGMDHNFGAFTTARSAKAMKSLGCSWTIVGHSEERRDLLYVLDKAGVGKDVREMVVSEILHERIKCALAAGLKVLFCVGEAEEQVSDRFSVLSYQLSKGLEGLKDVEHTIVVGYEPIWAIGPNKTPPAIEYIDEIAAYIKNQIEVPVVYGGGLKLENSKEIASGVNLDGGLIALTRFKGNIGFYPDEFLSIVESYLAFK